ncbi:MAG TPA: CARDB domain-containing protein [Tepidisphaeraceae bacterium]|jgi:uncharacterized delta-60 repeat protein|nr:CARDB domain-containing protein [Tepidisphaeraceae bacterium]
MIAYPSASIRARILGIFKLAVGASRHSQTTLRHCLFSAEGLEPRRLLAAVSWVGASSGDWDTAANWSNAAIPTAADDVTINTSPGITVTHSTGNDAVNSITSNNPFILSGGSLTVATTVSLTKSFTIAGGILSGATITGTGGELMVSPTGGVLDGATLDSDISLPDGANLTITNGVTLNNANIVISAVTTSTAVTFNLSSSPSINGTGGIVLGGSAPSLDLVSLDNSVGGLTIGAGIAIAGAGGTIATAAGAGTITLNGAISANAIGSGVNIDGQGWDNEGTISALNGGTMNINADVGSNGSITETNSTLLLGGIVTDITNVTRSGGTINLAGFLSSDSGTFTFNNQTGSWNLTGGMVGTCTLVFTNGNSLIPTSDTGTFDDVTLDSDLMIPDGASLTVTDGLTMVGANVTLEAAESATTLNFLSNEDQDIAGGQIDLEGVTPANNFVVFDNAGGNTTLDATASIVGSGGTIQAINSGGNATIIGSITASMPGQAIILAGDASSLLGSISAIGGGTLTDNANLGVSGSISETDSTLNLGATYGSISNITATGGTVNLTGTLNFFGGTATLNAATGPWNLEGGTVQDMHLAFTGTDTLIPTIAGGTFSNVTLDSDLDVPANAVLHVINGLMLSGTTITLETDSLLEFDDAAPQTLGGTGTIALLGGEMSSIGGGSGLTVNSTVAIEGAGLLALTPDDLILGNIDANLAGLTLSIAGSSTTDQGIVSATNGAILNIEPTLGSAMLYETNSTINFTGTISSIPGVAFTGGTLDIAGTLELDGSTQTFTDQSGPWQLSGTVDGGTIAFTGAGSLMPVGQTATLSNVTLDGNMTVPDGVNLNIINNLIMNNATITIAADALPTSVTLENSEQQFVDGTGTFVFGGNDSGLDEFISNDTMAGALIGPDITIEGSSGTIETIGSAGGVTMLGVVSANSPNQSIVIDAQNIHFEGTLSANGGDIWIEEDFAVDSGSTVDVLIGDGYAGQLNVTGNASLGGALNIELAPGYVPPIGSAYNVVTYGGSSNAFDMVSGLTSANVTFSSNAGPSALVLTTMAGAAVASNVDLAVTTLTDTPGLYGAGDDITGSGQFSVTGSAGTGAGFLMQIVLSQDAVYGNPDDVVLETIPLAAAAANSSGTFQISAPLPDSALPGAYHLIAVMDIANQVAETNETNNVFVGTTNDITVGPSRAMPSSNIYITVVNPVYTAGNYAAGDTFTLTGTAQNFGPGDTGVLTVQLDLSQDTVFGNRDDIVLDSMQIGQVDGPGSTTGPLQGVIPANIPAGSYHVAVQITSTMPALETEGSANTYISPAADVVIPGQAVVVKALPVKIGSPDPNFGVNGLAVHDVGITTTADVAVQSDGKSVIVGTTGTPGNGDFALTRYTANGSIDTTFGTDGKVTTDFGGDDQAAAVYILPSGKILVVGTSVRTSGSEFAIAQYNADGSLDTTFGNGTGMVLTNFATGSTPSTDLAHAVTVRGDGVFFVAGTSDASGTQDMAVSAYTPAGALLSSFGGTGRVLVDFSGGIDAAQGIALQKNGEIVLAGSTENTATGVTAIALARLKSTGILDKAFGAGGKVTKSIRGVDDEAASVAITKNQQIVVGGFSATGSMADGTFSTDFALAEFTSSGKAVGAFSHGAVTTSFGQPSAITKIVIAANGDIVASGRTNASLTSVVPNELEVALARYTANGALDKTFSATGTSIITLESTTAAPARLLSPADTTGMLMQEFQAFKESTQGTVTTTPGGELLDVGTSGTDTVEAAIVTSGVDLVAHLVGKVPASVVGGAKGSVAVLVNNTGPDAATGAVTVNLYASTDTAADNNPMLIKSLPGNVHLKVNGSQSFKFSFAYPAGLAAGSYYIVAQVSSTSLSETNVANNTIASGAVSISKGGVDLTGSKLLVPSSVTLGSSASVSFTIANIGSAPASGAIAIEFLASSDGTAANGQMLATVNGVKLGLKAGASKAFKESVMVPSALPAGTYYLLALLDPSNTLNDANVANNLIVSSATFAAQS